MKIWKGLHYCLWMSDKPLVQVCTRRVVRLNSFPDPAGSAVSEIRPGCSIVCESRDICWMP